jgi:N,N'-diacetyllegionaminate synthase
MPDRTLVIAEIGVNHDGELDKAIQLVDCAAEAGADVVKFQTYVAENLVTKDALRAEYQINNSIQNESQLEMLKRLSLSNSDFEAVFEHCSTIGIEFLSTAFDLESFEFLISLGLKRAKIPSGEITNKPLLRKVAQAGLPIIISTGMATHDEVASALDVLIEESVSKSEIVVLHCTTNYPAPLSEVNLKAMVQMGIDFGLRVGYSDHTEGIGVASTAVALGAVVIEKHLTLSRSLDGPDHAASLEPDQFHEMVDEIRKTEMCLGSSVKSISESERQNRFHARKSIVAKTVIKKGEILTEENITTKRPFAGLSPMMWDNILGVPAKRDFHIDECIEL